MPTKTQQATITITGDRQTGKSHLLELAALDAARRGDRVLYQCESRLVATERFHHLEKAAFTMSVLPSRVMRANGDQRIEWANGGRILFHGDGRGTSVDLHILDNVDGEPHPCATRVMRAVVTT